MNKLFLDKKYEEVVQVYEKFFQSITDKMNKGYTNPFHVKIKSQKQIIPFGHLRLVTTSLLLIVCMKLNLTVESR